MALTSTFIGKIFVDNFALLLVSAVMFILALQHFKNHKKVSICTILLLGSVLLIEIFSDLESYAKEHYSEAAKGYYGLAMFCAISCYVLRPACLYLVILMNDHPLLKKRMWLAAIPLAINFIIFNCSWIPGTKDVIFGYSPAEGGQGLVWGAGILHYSGHVVSALYLVALLFLIIISLKAKHLDRSFILIVCAVFVIAAVVIESFFNDNSNIEILNLTIVISASLYYLYLYMGRTQIDGLTGLFNRETFYQDKSKMDTGVTSVIQFDMNGLKFINDNYGHSEGDKALRTIAHAIEVAAKKNMYAYRLGGDEFVVLVRGGKEEDVLETIETFKNELSQTTYKCSIGYSHRVGRDISLKQLLKEAEKAMYADKEEFYKNAELERRKA